MYASSLGLLLVLGATARAAYLDGFKYIHSRDLADSYDYVIVGGGHAGVVISSRLAQASKASVLVIEAGDIDQAEEFVTIPRQAGNARATKYDWNYTTVQSSTINNRAITVPAGKLIGGGTILNGMALDRGAASDYDAWEDLGNTGWGWDSLLPYFKKYETFTPPDPALAAEFNITWDPNVHGFDGPIFASYPRYLNPTFKNWFRGLSTMGIELEKDGASGRAVNAFWAPNALHPVNMSRSYARPGYYDAALTRSNFHVLLNHQVTKLVGAGSPSRPVKFTAVELSGGAGQPIQRVHVKKEVIVSAGAIGSPKILQLSGVGPAALLKKLGIPVLIDLPGVGSNYQDHGYLMTFNTIQNAPPAIDDNTARQMYITNRTGPWTNSGPNAFVFIPLEKMSNRSDTLLEQFQSQSKGQYLRDGLHASVLQGYNKQKGVLLKRLASDEMGVAEVVWTGGSIMCSPQHPLARGYVEISANNPWIQPTIDFRYLSNPLDTLITADCIRWTRTVLQTPPLQELSPTELSPGPQITSDDQLATWIRGQVSTMFHSCCTNPMQPRNLGGVVDPDGLVYGSANLRVVDASIIPLIPGTHIQSTVYVIAEKIADSVKAAAGL